MKLLKQFFATAFAIIVLSSCTIIPTSMTKMAYYDKGITYERFLEMNDDIDEDYLFEIDNNLSKNKAKVYLFKEYKFTTDRDFIFIQHEYYEIQAYVFVDNKLYIWGRIDDLKKSKNDEVRTIAAQIVKNIKEEM